MQLVDFLLLFGIAAVLGLVIAYVIRAKKKGVKCIGCPDSAACSGKCSGCCAGCHACCDQPH